MFLSPDPMFAAIMRRSAYKLMVNAELIGLDAAQRAEHFQPLTQAPVFAYAKVDVTDLAAVQFLFEQGFRLVDSSTTFDKPVIRQQNLSGNTQIRFAQPDDALQTMRVARTSFHYSRFHLDPQIPKPIADEIKAVWAGNYFKGQRGEAMVLALVNDRVAGFLQLLYRGETLVIDLIAVEEKHRRKKIAHDLIAYAQANCSPHAKMLVSTQLANFPSMRLYEEMGFRIQSAQHIFHYHK